MLYLEIIDCKEISLVVNGSFFFLNRKDLLIRLNEREFVGIYENILFFELLKSSLVLLCEV